MHHNFDKTKRKFIYRIFRILSAYEFVKDYFLGGNRWHIKFAVGKTIPAPCPLHGLKDENNIQFSFMQLAKWDGPRSWPVERPGPLRFWPLTASDSPSAARSRCLALTWTPSLVLSGFESAVGNIRRDFTSTLHSRKQKHDKSYFCTDRSNDIRRIHGYMLHSWASIVLNVLL